MKDEAAILAALGAAYGAEKRTISALDWKPDAQHGHMLRIPIACDCGPAITGVSIIGTAFQLESDERVTFQLCADVDGQDYRIARIDWKPRQPHTNRYGPTKGLTLFTSIHDFAENEALGLNKMQTENLPIVSPIVPEPPDFSALLIYVRDTFKLIDAKEIPVPPWSRSLLD